MKTKRLLRLLFVAMLAPLALAAPQPGFAAPPSNDTWENATAISSLPYVGSINVAEATSSVGDPWYGLYGSHHNVWYTYTPADLTPLQVSIFSSDYNVYLTVFTRTDSSWQWVAAINNYSPWQMSTVEFSANPATTYYLCFASAWSELSPGTGNLHFALAGGTVPNDHINSSVEVTTLPFSAEQDVSAATSDWDDPEGWCGYGTTHTVWYKLTLDSGTDVWVDPLGSTYTTHIIVYTGQPGSLDTLTCGQYSSVAAFHADPGVTYYIMVSANSYYWAGSGDLSLAIYEAPPPLDIEVSFGFGSVVPATGEATIRGTVTCNQIASYSFSTTVQQKTGQRLIEGYASGYGTCTPGAPVEWSSAVYTNPPAPPFARGRAATMFTAGPATLLYFGMSAQPRYGWSDYVSIDSQRITLRGR